VLSYFEDYFINLISIIVSISLLFINYQFLALVTLLSYFILNIGIILVVVVIKADFISLSLIVGNLITIYLFSLVAVFISWLLYILSLGYIIYSLLLYLFLSDISSILVMLSVVELFALIFQTLTLGNRISINIISGSLLMQLLTIAMLVLISIKALIVLILGGLCGMFMFGFESVNYWIQLFIYSLLSLVYCV